MTITDVSKLTGLEIPILRKMRNRETVTLLSGPPFCKTIDRFGCTQYVYKRSEVLRWMKRRKFRITAGDAAAILGISRAELLGDYGHGQHSWENRKGKLIIAAGKNMFIWLPKIDIK